MNNVHRELEILSRCVAYSNLSSAAQHVGLSQPQLSRIVARIEEELKINCLDREARRKSGWTPAAYRLAELYADSSRRLDAELRKMAGEAVPRQIRAATLEGLIPLASQFCHSLMAKGGIDLLQLDVQDLNRLESLFLNAEVDFIFTSRPPGRRKHRWLRVLGYQALENVRKGPGDQIRVRSSFEFSTSGGLCRLTKGTRAFVSNSLEVRRQWIDRYGGEGVVPSEVSPQKSRRHDREVLLIGSDALAPAFWERISEL